MAEENTPIKLNDLLHIKDEDLKNWTLCLNNEAKQNDESKATFYWLTGDPDSEQDKIVMKHISWHKGANARNAFRNIDTKYCLQFIRREGTRDEWLFLGAYEIDPKNRTHFDEDGNELYNLIEMDLYSCFRERLIIEYKKSQGSKDAKLRISLINSIEVVEILDEMLRNKEESFKGYDNVSLPYLKLKHIIEKENDEWKQALENVYGVYVITDLSTHKLYVGAAFGDQGFWGRWHEYVETGGHGNDVVPKKLLESDPYYAEKHFKFTILETTTNSNRDYVCGRETYWKNALDSRKGGNNKN